MREALFSILGNAVPGRPFYDVFAGTGVVGLEALSRGAGSVTFVERDFRLIAELEGHIKVFGVDAQASIVRADVYRWVERLAAPAEPVTVFVSPPFPDFERRLDELLGAGPASCRRRSLPDRCWCCSRKRRPCSTNCLTAPAGTSAATAAITC